MGAYDYQRQLERGYSVTRDADGAVVRSVEAAEPGATLLTELADGRIASVVSSAEPGRRRHDAPVDGGDGEGSS